MKSTAKIIRILMAAAGVGAMLTWSAYFLYSSGFFSIGEGAQYLTWFIGNKPFWVKIFDFRGHDSAKIYRARDLASVFNYIDAQMILFSAREGFFHLLSFVYYFCLLGITGMHYYFSHKLFPRCGFWIRFLSIMLFLTNSVVFVSGTYIRTSKILVPLFTSYLFWCTTWIYMQLEKHPPGKLRFGFITGSIYICGLCMAISDETGIAFLSGFTVISILMYLFNRSKNNLSLSLAYITASVTAFLYRERLGPYLVYRTIGIWPKLWGIDPSMVNHIDIHLISDTASLFLTYISGLFGNIGNGVSVVIPVTVFGMIAAVAFRENSRHHSWQKIIFWPIIYLLGILMVIGTMYLMGSKLVELYVLIATLWYYPLPLITLFYLVFTFVTCLFISNYPKLQYFMIAVYLLFVGLNLHTLNSKLQIFQNDYNNSWQFRAHSILHSIKYPQEDITNQYYIPVDIEFITAMRQRLNK
jgi:hypothetical protein